MQNNSLCDAVNKKGVTKSTKKTNRKAKREDAPACKNEASNLREACELARRDGFTNDEDFGKGIVDFAKFSQQYHSLTRLYSTFQNTIETFRKLEVFFIGCGGGEIEAYFPFRRAMQILGITYPDTSDAENDFVNQHIFDEESYFNEDDIFFSQLVKYYLISEKALISIIEEAGLHPEITVRLTKRFAAYVAEKIEARWGIQ